MADYSFMFSMLDYFDNEYNDSDDGGIPPSIWGPPTWKSLHSISFGYPTHPTLQDKIRYKLYFRTVGYSLPCKSCRESYFELIKAGQTELTDQVVESRDTLTLWLYNLHNAINEKINVKYNITYQQVTALYESFRATCKNNKCVKTSDSLKESSFPITLNKPLSKDLAQMFSHYAKQRGLNDFDKKSHAPDDVMNILKYMQSNDIKSIEDDGPFIGYPTRLELQLIARDYSNIPLSLLTKIAAQLSPKKYKFSN